MNLCKIGLNVHHKMRGKDAPRDYSAAEKTALWSFFEQLRPATSLFMELDWARQAKRLVPDCAVVFRPEGDTDWRTVSPRQFYDSNAPACDGGKIVLNVLNEPSGYADKNDPDSLKKLAHWCLQVMDMFGSAGLPVVIPNFGVGHPDLSKLSDLQELWAGLVGWSKTHYFGYHPYFGHKGLDSLDGRLMRWRTVLDYIGNPNVRVIGTETGSDDLLDGSGKRGYKDYWTGDSYAKLSIEAAEKYFNHPQFIGGCWYCYGNTGRDRVDPFRPGIGQDWWTFDFSTDGDFKSAITEYAKMPTQTPVPTPPPAPTRPPIPKPGRYIISRTAQGMNVRDDAKENARMQVTLQANQRLTILPGEPRSTDKYDWILVDGTATVEKNGSSNIVHFRGWSAVTTATELKPDLEPQPEPPEVDDRQMLINLIQAQIVLCDAAIKLYTDHINLLMTMAEQFKQTKTTAVAPLPVDRIQAAKV